MGLNRPYVDPQETEGEPAAAPPPSLDSMARFGMTDEKRAAQIRALMREREGCARAGLADRVAAIDASLRALGVGGAPPVKRAAKRKAG